MEMAHLVQASPGALYSALLHSLHVCLHASPFEGLFCNWWAAPLVHYMVTNRHSSSAVHEASRQCNYFGGHACARALLFRLIATTQQLPHPNLKLVSRMKCKRLCAVPA
jgi:hypothetical protein